MKKKLALLSLLLSMLLVFSACTSAAPVTTENITTETVTEAGTVGDAEVATREDAEASEGTKGDANEAAAPESLLVGDDSADVRIGSLKGPTTMGLVNLMDKCEKGEAGQKYSFEVSSDASVITAKLLKGELDVAFIPANVASVLYNKSKGKVQVLNLNTLGVLYCVTGNKDIKRVYSLSGKTVVMTGQGNTPEYVTKYLLNAYGITDCTIEYKSEATEVAAALAKDPELIGILPQPFATVALMQNENLRQAFSLSDEWRNMTSAQMVTGVTVVRSDFAKENADKVKKFMEEEKESAETANSDPSGTGALVAKYGIIEKAPVAEKAIPLCNITYIDGEEMKKGLSGYLDILNSFNPESIGGKIPSDDFYYIVTEE